jgi:hypothetical protein
MQQTDHADVERPNDNEALQEARERAREVRRLFVTEWSQTGRVSDTTKVQAGRAAVDYRDVLVDYRNEITDPPWQERDLDWIMELVNEQVETEIDGAGLGRGGETETRPAFTQVDPIRLYRLTKSFDEIWRELGFGAETGDEDTNGFKITA